MQNRKKVLYLSVILVLVICIISAFIISNVNIDKEENKFQTHIAFTHTQKVGGLIPYHVKSNCIIALSEEYFLNINDSDMTYDELVSEIGEPNGTVGSGIIRHYWRIGENKYAVCLNWGDTLYFEIWNKKEAAVWQPLLILFCSIRFCRFGGFLCCLVDSVKVDTVRAIRPYSALVVE